LKLHLISFSVAMKILHLSKASPKSEGCVLLPSPFGEGQEGEVETNNKEILHLIMTGTQY
jgi:hypothetical protein